MIVLDLEQGTPEWYQARAGVATASELSKVITASGRPSSQQDEYLALLIGEYVTGEGDEDSFAGFWMERGKELEPEARAGYRLMTGHDAREVGFVYKDETRLVGCSPDSLIYSGDNPVKGAEIKCPKARNHIAYWYMNRCPDKYKVQVQSSMWITGLDQWDFVSHHPNYDLLISAVEPDEKFQSAIGDIVGEFVDKLAKARNSDRVQELIGIAAI